MIDALEKLSLIRFTSIGFALITIHDFQDTFTMIELIMALSLINATKPKDVFLSCKIFTLKKESIAISSNFKYNQVLLLSEQKAEGKISTNVCNY